MCHDATTRALIDFHALSGAGINKFNVKKEQEIILAFSFARDSIHEAFFHLDSVPLESTVADALE